MSKRMLINALHPQQVRVAIVDGTQLESYQVDMAEAGLTRGNIYRGVVANIQPSLNAAFVDLGEDKHGFLPIDDVLASAYHHKPDGKGRPKIDEVLQKGRPLLVQVTKDGIGSKGPALTTNLAIAGRYLVMMPFDEVRGVSRKASDDGLRKKAKQRVAKLALPEGMGAIVRTNGLDQTQVTLGRDLNALRRLWKKIYTESRNGRGPRLLYTDQDLIIQALRDHLDNTIEEVVVDTDATHEQATSYMAAFMPRSKTRLQRYSERLPLFSRYQIENQVDRIYSRTVALPSGGSIVIDGTEALTAIDVNSGRATKTADHEESILNVNLEAAHEVGRQLRLRDIGGLVVVDFIDMRYRKNQRKLEKAMRQAMKADRARHTVSNVSSNGLVEINRQRLKQALQHRTHRACPTCSGVGSIASLEFAAMSLLGRIEARAAAGTLAGVVVGLHPEVADALQNHHRREIVALEQEFGLRIEIIAAANLHRTEERVEWRRREAVEAVAAARAAKAIKATDLTISDNDDDLDLPGAPKKRRRRGSRGGRGRSKAVAQAADTSDESTSAAGEGGEPSDDDAPTTTTRSRRRRRGGRGRGKVTAASETAGEATADADATEDDGETGAKPRAPRRRGGRGRGRKTLLDAAREVSGEGEGESTEDKPATKGRTRRGGRGRSRVVLDAAREVTPEASEAEGDDDTPAPTSRRRRGGRGRGSKKAAAASDAPAPNENGDPSGTEDDPATPVRRLRGGRGRPRTQAKTATAEDTAQAADGETGTTEDEAPPKTTRRRTTRGRSRSRSKTATSAASSESAEDAAPGTATSEDADAPAAKPATRRLRGGSRGGRGRSRTTTGDGEAASEPVASEPAASTDVAPAAWRWADPEPTLPPEPTAAPTTARAEPATAPPAPTGEPTPAQGDDAGTDAPTATGSRWRWWRSAPTDES